MVKAFEVGLPIADVLVIQPVNHVLSQDQVRQERVGAAVEEVGWNQICLMYRSPRVTLAWRSVPGHAASEVRLQLGEHVGRGEVPRQRFMTVQHVTRMFLYHDVDRIEQAIKVTLHDEWRTDVRHDEIADKDHAQIGQMDEHGVVRFSAVDGNQLDAGSANFQLGGMVYGCVGLKITYIIEIVAVTKEGFPMESGPLSSPAISSR